MKLVGGDSGRYERETFVEEVLIAPSERAVVDVHVRSCRRVPARASHARPHVRRWGASSSSTNRHDPTCGRHVRRAPREPRARRRTGPPRQTDLASRARQDPRTRRGDGHGPTAGRRCAARGAPKFACPMDPQVVSVEPSTVPDLRHEAASDLVRARRARGASRLATGRTTTRRRRMAGMPRAASSGKTRWRRSTAPPTPPTCGGSCSIATRAHATPRSTGRSRSATG